MNSLKLVSRRRTRHGLTHTPEHDIWRAMLGRCNNPRHKRFADYGGRGIKVCTRWKDGEGDLSGFECFIADMGRRPARNLSLDRINNNGGYAPNNCRWATRAQQTANRRSGWLPSRVSRETFLYVNEPIDDLLDECGDILRDRLTPVSESERCCRQESPLTFGPTLAQRVKRIRMPLRMIAEGAQGVAINTICDVLNERSDPRTSTVAKIIRPVEAEERALLDWLIALHGIPQGQ